MTPYTVLRVRLCWRRTSVRTNQAALPGRPRRQPAAPAGAPAGARGPRRRRVSTTTELRAVEDEAIRDVVQLQEDVGLQSRHRRRVPPRLLAHGLHLPARRHHARPRTTSRSQFNNADGDIEFTPAALHVDGRSPRAHDLRRRTSRFLQDASTTGDAEADDPVPEHGPLPRRPRRDRPGRLPRHREFWTDLTTRTPTRSSGSTSSAARYLQFDDTSLAYLNDPKQRAHDRARSAATPSTSTRSTSATSTRRSRDKPGGHDGHDAHVPRQLPLLVGGRGRLRLRRRGAVQRARRRRLLHGVGRRALGRLRAAALRAQGQDVVLGLVTTKRGELETQGRPQAPHRGGVEVRRPRPALPLAAVRLRVHGRGQRAHVSTRRSPSCASSSRPPRRSGVRPRPTSRPSARAPPDGRARRRPEPGAAAGSPGRRRSPARAPCASAPRSRCPRRRPAGRAGPRARRSSP